MTAEYLRKQKTDRKKLRCWEAKSRKLNWSIVIGYWLLGRACWSSMCTVPGAVFAAAELQHRGEVKMWRCWGWPLTS